MSGQAQAEGDPEAPVQHPLPGSGAPYECQVLTNPGKQCVTFLLPEAEEVLSMSALVDGRAWSRFRSRFSGHDQTSWGHQMILHERRSDRAASGRTSEAGSPTQRSGISSPCSDSGRGPKMRRSDSAMATSLMLASRRRIKPC